METLILWKNRVVRAAEAHEGILSCGLILIGIVLILIAFFGKTEHKIAAGVYIIL